MIVFSLHQLFEHQKPLCLHLLTKVQPISLNTKKGLEKYDRLMYVKRGRFYSLPRPILINLKIREGIGYYFVCRLHLLVWFMCFVTPDDANNRKVHICQLTPRTKQIINFKVFAM